MSSQSIFSQGRILSVAYLIVIVATISCAHGKSETTGNLDGEKELLVFIGTYTRTNSEGIYSYRMDLKSGALERIAVASGIENPSFLAIHPNQRYLYSVSETVEFNGQKTGSVWAFTIDVPTGHLSFLNFQPSAGSVPCHLVVDSAGRNLLLANYGSGSVATFPIDHEGRLGQANSVIHHNGSSLHPLRQKAPHAHSINLDIAGRFALAADLGVDKLFVYRFNAQNGTLESNNPPSVSVTPGSGPRHFTFHPTGQFGYVINEMSSTITAFRYDGGKGVLETLQSISTLPEGFKGKTHTAEIQVRPSGRFLYGSNRGHDSIAIFSIDESTGRLTAKGHEPTRGRTPRNFQIDPNGNYLLAANQDSDSVVVFRIHPETGELEPTSQSVEVPMPVCIRMMPR